MSNQRALSALPDGNGGLCQCPEIMTEEEVIRYLRIPKVSNAADFKYVIDNLIRAHDLPCIHICRRRLYPIEGVRKWITRKLREEMALMGKKL